MWLSAVLICVFPVISATPFNRQWEEDMSVRHSWLELPRGWRRLSSPSPNHTFDLHVGLKQHRLDVLISDLLQISDPTHPRYGQHLTKEETEDLVKPHPDTLDAVEDWIISHGINSSRFHYPTGGQDHIDLRVSVAEAERMLNAKYEFYRHKSSGDTILRTMSYSLPRALQPHIDVVSPTTYFGTTRSMRSTSFLQPEVQPLDALEPIVQPISDTVRSSSCDLINTPACLRDLYNTTNYEPQAMDRNRLGIAGYLDQFSNDADLQTFESKFRPEAIGFTVPTVQINGGRNNQTEPGIEANLDVQYGVGISYPTPNVYYSTGGSPPYIADSQTPMNTNEPYLDWLTYILAQPTIPQVITTSYGDDEQTVPVDYATRICNLFVQLGARGTTVFFSSGDFGVGGGDCFKNDGSNRVEFQPGFPASCPFVTAVGGTTHVNPEIGVNFSGGGFSRYFTRPAYQSGPVSQYLVALGDTYAGQFNPNGRAYPDIAAQGTGYQVVVGGHIVSVGGTSASSPTVAAIFSLLNDVRLSQNKSTLGFINPLLYSTAVPGLNDIVSGSNPGCQTDGFTAKEGWDPVTGLGTPNFSRLRSLISG